MENPIFKRVSIRDFSEKSVEESKILNLLKAAMAAPSAGNQQPWEFVVIRNKAILEKLSTISPYATPVKKSTVSILVLGNKDIAKYPEHIEHDLSAAIENILLQSVVEGLGGVWIAISPEVDRVEKTKNILNLRDNIIPFALVPVGYGKFSSQVIDRYSEERVTYID